MSTPWNPNYKRKSKTYTSSEVKARYNRKHYDSITFRAGKGSNEAINQLAQLRGMSKAEYIRHLIIADAKSLKLPELSAIVGGGDSIVAFARLLGGSSYDPFSVFDIFNE